MDGQLGAQGGIDHRRRLEEWRYKESCRRNDEIKNLLGTLLDATSNKFDPHFAQREAERRAFYKDMKGLVLSQSNGGTRARPFPIGQRNGQPRSRRRSRVRS